MLLQSIVEELGYETQSYCGRAMREYCLGVKVPHNKTYRSVIADIIVALADKDRDMHNDIADAICGMQTDSLGKGTIVYFPGIKYEEGK